MAGRRISLLIDRVLSTAHARLPPRPLLYDGGSLRIGELAMTLAGKDNLRYPLAFTADGSNRVLLQSGGRTFVLGTRTNAPRHPGDPEMEFDADEGDHIAFATRRSLVGWATPFDYSFLARTPSWKRYVYYELTWRKAEGQRLDMRWRYQQNYYSGVGWTTPDMMFNSETGLLDVVIR